MIDDLPGTARPCNPTGHYDNYALFFGHKGLPCTPAEASDMPEIGLRSTRNVHETGRCGLHPATLMLSLTQRFDPVKLGR